MRFIDSHAHLQDRAFVGSVDAVIERAQDAGVTGIVVLGYDLPSNVAAVKMAERHPGTVFAAVGIHPHDAAGVSAAGIEEVAALAARPEVIAVGEIGLDFYRNLSPAARQREVLEAHLAIALTLGKPVAVHSRSAEDDIAGPLDEFSRKWRAAFPTRAPGVMHCFGGDVVQALAFARLGFLISVACSITYPRSAETRRLAAVLPLDRILVETDSPYLPPQAMRGKRNEPAFVRAAAAAIAEVRGVPLETIAETTTANAERLFDIRVASSSLAGSI